MDINPADEKHKKLAERRLRKLWGDDYEQCLRKTAEFFRLCANGEALELTRLHNGKLLGNCPDALAAIAERLSPYSYPDEAVIPIGDEALLVWSAKLGILELVQRAAKTAA
jgi:hypothetical protein